MLSRLSSANGSTAATAEAEDDERQDQQREHGELHLPRLDLLAEIFGRAADHQPGDEDGDDRHDQHAVEAGADAARQDAAGEQVNMATPPPSGMKQSCMALTAPVPAPVVTAANSGVRRLPKRTSLPSMLPRDGRRRAPSDRVPALSAQ